MSDTPPEDSLLPYKRFVCKVGRRLGVDSKTIGKKKGEKIDKMLNRVIEALDAKLAAPAKILDDLMKEREASKERDERKAKELDVKREELKRLKNLKKQEARGGGG